MLGGSCSFSVLAAVLRGLPQCEFVEVHHHKIHLLNPRCSQGNDASSGTTPAAAFRTLDRARVATHGATSPLSVGILPGECFPVLSGQTTINFSLPVLSLDASDSGTASAPITYVSLDGPGSVKLVAGARLDASLWTPFQGPIYKLDLAAAGLAQWGFGALSSGGLGQCTNDRAELFFGGVPMTLARYPNVPLGERPSAAAFLHVGEVLTPSSFTINNTRLLSWAAEANPWLHGVSRETFSDGRFMGPAPRVQYWAFDWADNHVHALSFTQPGGPTANVTVNVDPKTPVLYQVDPNARFYGENLLCELDVPGASGVGNHDDTLFVHSLLARAGEYYLDPKANVLYFYPPAPLSSTDAYLSMSENGVKLTSTEVGCLLDVPRVSLAERWPLCSFVIMQYVTFDGLAVSYARNTGIDAENVQARFFYVASQLPCTRCMSLVCSL